MRSTIVFKLSIWIAVISILSACTSVYFTFLNGRAMLTRAAEERLSTATQVMSQRYRFFIQEMGRTLLFAAKLPAIEEFKSTPNLERRQQLRARLGGVFAELINTHPEYFQVRLIDAENHGVELVRADRGVSGAHNIEGAALQEKAHFPYVFNTRSLPPNAIYVSNIHLNHERGILEGYGKPQLVLATPIYNAQAKLVAIFVINIDLERMFALVQRDLPANLTLIATNSEGDYLIHPNPQYTFGFDLGQRVLIQENIPESQRIFSGEIDQLVTPTRDFRAPEKQAVAALIKVPFEYTADQKYLVIGLYSDLDDVFADATTLSIKALRLSLFLSLILVVISILLARRIAQPIQSIAKTFGRFREGEVVPEVTSDSNDELGLLAKNFTSMAKSINDQLQQLTSQRQQLQQAAHHDLLTGLPNRLLFEDRIEQALVAAKRDQIEVAVMLVDLDEFKPVNDTFGHHIGDRLLDEAAKRMLGCVRESDTLARYGGDEFMVILSQRDHHHASLSARHIALQVAEKIRSALQQPFTIDDYQLRISASLGISLYPEDAQDKESLIKNADLAMYYAKSNGRNKIKFFSEIISE